MSVWYCLPSARPAEQVRARMAKWTERGYKIAMVRDELPLDFQVLGENMLIVAREYWGRFPGYAVAMNELVIQVFQRDHACDWVVVGADDIDPDPNFTADEIAAQCSTYFALYGDHMKPTNQRHSFGVMQPTGDRWGDKDGAYIDRVAGSPWIGRRFVELMYGGRGPYWPEYTHMGVDEELQHVALAYGAFWQRPDLIHYHDHWGRPRAGEKWGNADRMPAFLAHANSPAEWQRYKRIFAARLAAGFPGSDPK